MMICSMMTANHIRLPLRLAWEALRGAAHEDRHPSLLLHHRQARLGHRFFRLNAWQFTVGLVVGIGVGDAVSKTGGIGGLD